MTTFPRTEPAVLAAGGDRLTRRLLEFLFSSHGYRVTTAPDPTSALARPEHRYALILLDTELCDDGLALLRAIKREQPHVPVVVITTRAEPGDTVRALDAGADEYVVKPFEPAELIARSEAILRRYGAGAPQARADRHHPISSTRSCMAWRSR